MNAQEFKASLTVQDIINFVTQALGSEGYQEDNAGNPIFQTIDHNARGQGKYKLYYYADKQVFVSYTVGETMDIYELVQKAGYATDFKSAFYFVANFFGYDIYSQEFKGSEAPELTADWDLLNKFASLEIGSNYELKTKQISNAMIEYFPPLIPDVWYQEGISIEAMQKFGIRMDTVNEKIIIPHYDINGQLVGIRGRAFNWYDLEKGMKYAPVCLGIDTWYNHPLGEHLYGLWLNKDTIKRTKKCVVFEGEKSVMLAETYYPGNNFTVAVCGSAISQIQVDLLLQLGVTEIIIAFDNETDNTPASPTTLQYQEKILQLASLFTPYVNVYYILDITGKLEYKDSPIDKGKETFEFLLKNKRLVPTYNTLVTVKGKKRR